MPHSSLDLQHIEKLNEDIIVCAAENGRLSSRALFLIRSFFRDNPGIDLVYGDEDVMDDRGYRSEPWFKPDWSPDTFLTQFYFGSLFAARREALLRVAGEEVSSPYRLCLELARKAGGFARRKGRGFPVGHIPHILFHRHSPWREELSRGGPECDGGESFAAADSRIARTVSVIIPSKDNPDMLKSCVESVTAASARGAGGDNGESPEVQIIVVDNGSTAENRGLIAALVERAGGVYLYREEAFNFSRMCNRGAEAAEGELLLFLNDDVETPYPDFIRMLARKAVLPYVGAVGAKLLYPDSDVIQHAGITNVHLGPMHKLQGKRDGEEAYFGYNRGDRNRIGVTGACLMVRREVFRQAGGFCEELPVAFNDVDLCYTLFEQGYYNVIRNGVVLYHHESVSRGNDAEDPVKVKRLMEEKNILYSRHSELYANDPFYHPYLAQDAQSAEIAPSLEVEGAGELPFSRVERRRRKLPVEDACLRVDLEYAGTMGEWLYGVACQERDKSYYIQGYAFVIGSDNARYSRKLLLREAGGEEKGSCGQVYEVSVFDKPRPDVEVNLPDQVNVGLTGYAARIPSGVLPEGKTFQIGMAVADRCSTQRLCRWINRFLKTEED